MYICGGCGKGIELGKNELIRCPYCGHKILIKERPAVARAIKAK